MAKKIARSWSNKKKICREAVNILEKRGWVQGKFTADDGRVCANEALRLIDLHDIRDETAVLDRIEIRKDLDKKVGTNFIIWHDRPSTTYKDVVRVLKSVV